MKVTILGCGASSGVPQIGGEDGRGWWGACDPANPLNHRTRSSILVEGGGGGRLLVDTGPDLRTQMLACGVPAVDAILYTHDHADHVMGLDEVRIVNRLVGRPMQAFATARTLDSLKRRFDYAFLPSTEPLFFRPAVDPVPIVTGETVAIAGHRVETFSQDHAVMETLGFRIGAFAYSTDVVHLPEESLARLHGLDTWVVGCFQRRPHKVHANLDQVLDWVGRIRPRRTVLTHMSPDLDHGWLLANLPPGIEPGHDGMVLAVPG
ncbi:MBL fold metallo-hydrolase [Roseomonas sp. PWR1]|uniref:MBL fold metallo-hydrolase n=1 Tax=Roseomonas nitratireducens TaxID=2820810 RepID=A0ABS4ANE3_9PROT|nr:MBL fold metallo-hydrolase [Neoroseomonas nitratireducens]MBP0462878.1 MBL fold metallo-hydrolase [Neoroseomonas nitratireducens]